MGDEINVAAEGSAIGSIGSRNQNVRIGRQTIRDWKKVAGTTDLKSVAAELAQLVQALRVQAANSEQYADLLCVSEACDAAAKGDGPGMLGHLKRAGKWTWEVAEKLAIGVGIHALKGQAGL